MMIYKNYSDFFTISLILLLKLNVVFGELYTDITPEDLVFKENYPSERHSVITEDGYILTVYRIPNQKGSIPVFIQHGLIESSIDWLYNGRNKSLPFILWDQGYDVWMGNTRGNTHSKNHVTLSTSDPDYWDFSWNELGIYDLPAAINYIYNVTNVKLFYIGHSMGCSSFAVMASEKPEVAKNVRAMFAFAPAVYETHLLQPIIKAIAPFWKEVQVLLGAIGIRQLFGRNVLFDFISNHVCSFAGRFCEEIIFFIGGYDREQLQKGLSPLIMSNFPSGTSVKLFTHWLQQIHINKFRNFDYGQKMNLQIYNSTEPPEYDISKIEVPIAAFYSDNDWIVGPEDVINFYEQVPNKLGIHRIDYHYSHFDFLWGLNAAELVYPIVLELMSQFRD